MTAAVAAASTAPAYADAAAPTDAAAAAAPDYDAADAAAAQACVLLVAAFLAGADALGRLAEVAAVMQSCASSKR